MYVLGIYTRYIYNILYVPGIYIPGILYRTAVADGMQAIAVVVVVFFFFSKVGVFFKDTRLSTELFIAVRSDCYFPSATAV